IISPILKSPAIPTLVANQIIDLISRGRLKPGDKLPSELEVARRFCILTCHVTLLWQGRHDLGGHRGPVR
ncbi:MAG TPA: GntR family transcriptional regulator, partial [Deltaproteobacteria bacterium]|nr:GntR family transcriptional regulator [Deltaproteobacteria bacterium]